MTDAPSTSLDAEATGTDSILDVGGLKVGHWTNRRAATGCTVILAPAEGAVAAADVRGGAPGTRETDLLEAGRLVSKIHAVLLSGGSAFGLDAATGVMRFLEERQIGYRTRSAIVPIVTGAVIFDLGIGSSTVRPDAMAGYRACRSASAHRLAQGSVGAGTGATVAKIGGGERSIKGGLGSASEPLARGIVTGALAVVNAVGEVIDPLSGRLVARRRAGNGESPDVIEHLRSLPGRTAEAHTNTTLAVVATNALLGKEQLLRLAAMAHSGLARTIRPAHSPADGDTVFALSVGTIPIADGDLLALGTLTTYALERAILRGVLRAESLCGVPSARDSSPAMGPSA